MDEVSQEVVAVFLKGPRPPIRSTWHTKHSALAGLFRFALQRGLLSTSPLPYFQVPKRPEYAKPYIYSTDELRRILDGSKILDARNRKSGQAASITPLTFRTLILVLYGAGLRLSEALALTVDDVDLSASTARRAEHEILQDPAAANRAQALVDAGARYAETRLGAPQSAALGGHLPAPPGRNGDLPPDRRALLQDGAQPHRHAPTRRCLLPAASARPAAHLRRARLVAWYRQGADVQLLLPKLSTYLGHIGLAETQHYLTMTPDLLREAGRRFERYAALEARP